MPAGRKRAVIRVLTDRVGETISKVAAMDECAKLGVMFSDERQFRLTVVELRKEGWPICSSSTDSGYFLASTLAEYQEFRAREYLKKIMDMRSTVFAMDETARAMFPAEYAEYKRQQAEAAGQPQLL